MALAASKFVIAGARALPISSPTWAAGRRLSTASIESINRAITSPAIAVGRREASSGKVSPILAFFVGKLGSPPKPNNATSARSQNGPRFLASVSAPKPYLAGGCIAEADGTEQEVIRSRQEIEGRAPPRDDRGDRPPRSPGAS